MSVAAAAASVAAAVAAEVARARPARLFCERGAQLSHDLRRWRREFAELSIPAAPLAALAPFNPNKCSSWPRAAIRLT